MIDWSSTVLDTSPEYSVPGKIARLKIGGVKPFSHIRDKSVTGPRLERSLNGDDSTRPGDDNSDPIYLSRKTKKPKKEEREKNKPLGLRFVRGSL